MNTAAVKLQGVSLNYRIRKSLFRHELFKALDSVSFDVQKGETLGIVGANGSGKSTLLRVMANIYGIDSGKISWDCSKVSLLSLALGFDNQLSGADNILISGMLLGARKQEIKKRFDEIVEFSELGPFIYKPVKTYSTGMRGRLGFAIAVKMQSDLLLIDEVMSVGDDTFRQKAHATMTDKIKSDQTVVLVSHSHAQIKALCQRALWLHQGQIKLIDAAPVVLEAYRDFFQPRTEAQ